jgi:hypothetical protein
VAGEEAQEGGPALLRMVAKQDICEARGGESQTIIASTGSRKGVHVAAVFETQTSNNLAPFCRMMAQHCTVATPA